MSKTKETYRQKARYGMQPTELLYNKKTTKLDIKVWLAIHYYLGVNEQFDLTYDELADEVESTKGGVFKSVARLIDENFLRSIASDTTKGIAIELANGCGQLKEKVSQRKQKKDKKFPTGNEKVSQRKQTGDHTLYIKEIEKNRSFDHKKLKKYLEIKLNQRLVYISQAKELIKLHARFQGQSKEESILFSIKNFHEYLKTKPKDNPIGYLLGAIKNNIERDASKGYFPDKVYTKDKKPEDRKARAFAARSAPNETRIRY